jgi:hypothetical protein
VRLRGALAPGGVLAVEVPNGASVRARRDGAGWALLGLPEHVSQFSPASLRALLARSGLELVALDTVPLAHYRRPVDALHPRHVLARLRLVAEVRTPAPSHPWRHELIRALAVRR